MRHHVRLWTAAAALVFAGAMLWAASANATHQQCECNASICSGDGFRKTLTDSSIDQLAGTSSWTYEICSPVAGTCQGGARAGDSCVDNEFCRRSKGQTPGDPSATCSRECVVDDFHDLSHVDIVLPGLGECVTDTQQIQIAQLGCPACDPVLSCSASDKDPSCGVGPSPNIRVLKCDVASGNLDPGECVKVQVTVAGESPTTGQGTIDEVTKSANQCFSDQICGPACDCGDRRDECLTRTPGFWGNHPHITSQFLPVTVCGNTFTSTAAATDSASCKASASEALCIAPGVEANKTCDKNPAYQQLVRQCTAARLNLAATAANGGSCGDTTFIEGCCPPAGGNGTICTKNQSQISSGGCIQQLDAFNNSVDTFALTPPPFDSPGPANPTSCKAASGNGWVSGKNCGAFQCK